MWREARRAGPSTFSLARCSSCCHVEKHESNIHALSHYLHLCEQAYMLQGIHMHIMSLRYLVYAENLNMRILWARALTHTVQYRHDVVSRRTQSRIAPQVKSQPCTANTTVLPSDLSVGVPLNSVYIPSVHSAPV